MQKVDRYVTVAFKRRKSAVYSVVSLPIPCPSCNAQLQEASGMNTNILF